MSKNERLDLHGLITTWNIYNGFPLTNDEVYQLYKHMEKRKDGM